jgi:hypothetical protein
MMKLVRFTLVCSLLILAAVPSYAIPCSTCIERDCESTPGSLTRCRPVFDPKFPTCETLINLNCVGFANAAAAPAMLAEWTVASIEISRPAEGTTVVTTSAAVAQATVSPATLPK